MALWFRKNRNSDVSTGPLARPFARLLVRSVILELVHHDLDNLNVVFPVLYYTEYKYQCETYSSQRPKEVTYIVRRK